MEFDAGARFGLNASGQSIKSWMRWGPHWAIKVWHCTVACINIVCWAKMGDGQGGLRDDR